MVSSVAITESFLQKLQVWQKKRQKKYFFCYSEESIAKAIAEVRNGTSVKAAAEKYNIPRKTLGNKISGKTPENRKMGPKTVSTENEEERLDY
ncbi:hypothetical protein WA026_020886 [Henosepilachna vigintioctopunctata]|uniref:HTH psq-type domain-containing protein n=1 Tax=Henosepilachna vigintioctopunctata TaxID=420089 RepID=A0AAW1URB2_9CUCU